jgi:hypothetical protein
VLAPTTVVQGPGSLDVPGPGPLFPAETLTPTHDA